MIMTKLNVEEYLDKFCKDIAHANKVAKLSLKLFDETNQKLKELSERQRELLNVSALLHDIGYYISSKKHHKHAKKIISQHKIEGFDETETLQIANIARYHRGKNPSKKHKSYSELEKSERKTVKRLAGILRIADGLDCGHLGLVRDLTVEYDKKQNVFSIILTPKSENLKPDITYAIIKKDLFEKVFKTQVIIKTDPNIP